MVAQLDIETKTILVVEDEWLLRMSVVTFLRDSGFKVLEASNSQERQAVFHTGATVELVCCNIGLPGEMDGVELVRWLRERLPVLKVIFTSAEQGLRRVQADVDTRLVEKPYAYDELRDLIRELLQLS
jgi:DNA-binding response OmpR family regulator